MRVVHSTRVFEAAEHLRVATMGFQRRRAVFVRYRTLRDAWAVWSAYTHDRIRMRRGAVKCAGGGGCASGRGWQREGALLSFLPSFSLSAGALSEQQQLPWAAAH